MALRGTKQIQKALDNNHILMGALVKGVRRALREQKDLGLSVAQ